MRFDLQSTLDAMEAVSGVVDDAAVKPSVIGSLVMKMMTKGG